MVMDIRKWQLSNASSPMLVRPSGRDTDLIMLPPHLFSTYSISSISPEPVMVSLPVSVSYVHTRSSPHVPLVSASRFWDSVNNTEQNMKDSVTIAAIIVILIQMGDRWWMPLISGLLDM